MNDRVCQFYLNNNDKSQSQSSNICIKIEPQSEVIASYRRVRGQCPTYGSTPTVLPSRDLQSNIHQYFHHFYRYWK
jgi:hypothetical protein